MRRRTGFRIHVNQSHHSHQTRCVMYYYYARDTRSDKMSNATSWMENPTVCHTIRYLSYEVGWSQMKLDGVGWNAYDVISLLLEKDNIIRVHCFKNKKACVYEQSIIT